VRFLSIIIVGTALIASALGAGIAHLQQEAEAVPMLQQAQAGDSAPGQSDQSEAFATGLVEGRSREIVLGFELTGRVLTVEVQEGDRVAAGAVVATLDSSVWQQQVAEAEASLAFAKAEKERLLNGQREETRQVFVAEVRVAKVHAERANKAYLRVVPLSKNKMIAEQAFDDHESELRCAEAELQLAESKAQEASAAAREDEVRIADAKIVLQEARLAHARAVLSKTELKAPCDGMILQVHAEPGELVGERETTPLVTMVDVSQLRVRALVEELDAVRMVTGMNASIVADGLPEQRFHGVVVSCAPCMVPKTHFSNRPGERADVKVREVVVALAEEQASLSRLVVGLPVDVYFGSQAR
jgi:HlyD family secretion protein